MLIVFAVVCLLLGVLGIAVREGSGRLILWIVAIVLTPPGWGFLRGVIGFGDAIPRGISLVRGFACIAPIVGCSIGAYLRIRSLYRM